ncbi:MAG: CHASE3 domain-containing protein [Planctomycetes bacterium]|nr:CHASE3 domain-containing protein [Planctomycetota bacterium]
MTSKCLPQQAFRRLLLRAVAAPPVLLGALALVFLGQVVYLLSTTDRVEHSDQVIARSNALHKVLVDGETGLRGYLLTGDAAFLEPYRSHETQSEPAFDELTRLVSDNPAQIERLADLRADHAEWRDFARRVIEARRTGGDYLTPVRNQEGKRRMDEMRDELTDFVRVEEQVREDRVRTARTATWLVGGLSLGSALLFGGALALLTRRQLLRVSGSYGAALAAAEARAETLRKSLRRIGTLHEIDRAILTSTPIPELIRATLRRVQEDVPARDALVVAPAPDGGAPRAFSTSDHPVEEIAPATCLAGGTQLISDLGAVERDPLQDHLFRLGNRSCLTVPLESGGERFGALAFAAPGPSAFTAEHREIADEIGRQFTIALHHSQMREQLRQYAEELERRVEERTRQLQESLGKVKQLQGLLPICAWCKKVRDDQNYWHQVEHYVAARTDARFTHGVCPACLRTLQAEMEAERGEMKG